MASYPSPPRRWRIGTQLIFLMVPLIAVASLVAAMLEYSRSQANLREKLTHRAKSLSHQIMADRQYYAATIVPRIAELGGTLGADYREVHGRFPLPATFVREVSEATAKIRNGYTANLISPWPINKEKGITDEFQRAGFEHLAAHPDDPYISRDTVNGQQVLRVLFADIASAQSCVSCHNAHARSPKHDFQLHDLMGGLEITMPMESYLRDERRELLMTLSGAAAMCLVVIAILALGTTWTVTQPLARLAARIRSMADSSLPGTDRNPAVLTGNEVASLTGEFDAMRSVIVSQQAELRQANLTLEQRVIERTEELRRTTADKERIASELRIASEIQRSILPRTFPPFPHRLDFQIYAETIPAREMGGDFYDFFLIDPDHLGVVIADVSDKGVPAAIFMAVSRSLIKATALKGTAPGDCLRHVNSLLCPDNDSAMFVTVFYGVLDTVTGTLVYSNAGHNHPYVLQADGRVEDVPGTGGMALGVSEGAAYETRRLLLKSGDTLFLYTDGITEAVNSRGQFYSEHRLRGVLGGITALDPTEMFRHVLRDVRDFSDHEAQADDITSLVLRYRGGTRSEATQPVGRLTVTLLNQRAEIQRLGEVVQEFGARNALPTKVVYALALALEEILINVISYGYRDGGEHRITVRVFLDGQEAGAEVEDDGLPFNPLDVPEPDLTVPLEERTIGGLGIHLTRKMMDRLEYRRVGHSNVLRMYKRIEG